MPQKTLRNPISVYGLGGFHHDGSGVASNVTISRQYIIILIPSYLILRKKTAFEHYCLIFTYIYQKNIIHVN